MLFTSHIAIAQTAGTIAAEDQAKDDIVVTGQKLVATGIEMSNSPKARAVVTQDYIEHTVPGQSIFNAINLVPASTMSPAIPMAAMAARSPSRLRPVAHRLHL